MPKPKKVEASTALVKADPREMTVGELIEAIATRELTSDVRSIAINSLRAVIAERTRPTGIRILVRRIQAHQTMSDGRSGVPIHLPDKYQELDNFATILEVGDAVTAYHPGDVIYMWGGAGHHLNEDLVLIEEKEVLGVVDLGAR